MHFKSRNSGVLGLATSLFVVLLAFQNCADAVFDNDETVSPSGSAVNWGASYKALCANRSSAVTAISGPSVGPVTGSAVFTVSSLDLLHNIGGSVVVFGHDGNSRIERIENISGSLVLCGVSVGTVSGVNGSLVVVGANIGSVDNTKGSIVVSGGQIQGTITNSSGSVVSTP